MKYGIRGVKTLYLFIADAVLAVILLCVFALFDHVLSFDDNVMQPLSTAAPVELTYAQPTATPVPLISETPEKVYTASQDIYYHTVPECGDTLMSEKLTLESAKARSLSACPVCAGGTPVVARQFDFPGVFTDGEVIQTSDSYRSANISVTLKSVKSSNQCYYVEDIYVSDIRYLSCVFAQDTVGSNITEKFESMASRSNSVAAINTDFYGFGKNSNGLVIRNGVLYRAEPNPKDDVLVLFKDGTVEMYAAGKVPSAETLMNNGAWQAFSFGPMLLRDGNKLSSYPDEGRNPKTVFGYVEPGHYKFIVADGGQDGYAKGQTAKVMAGIAQTEGCMMAYNLDGGQSSQMGFMGSFANKPEKGGRSISDILIVSDTLFQ